MKTQPKMPPDEEYLQFQHAIWEKLPKRKLLAGKDRVRDCISIIVQEWPDERFALAESDRAPNTRDEIKRDLMQTAKRHLHLIYGDENFGFIWTILLQAILFQLVALIFEWWKERRENRVALLAWQTKWRSAEES